VCVSTEVILTGTGVPHPSPGRAGAGTLLRSGDTILQFDAGRGTIMRLSELGIRPMQLSALFVTHVHSDHVIGIDDLVMTRWLEDQLAMCGPLPIIAPSGSTERFLRRMLDPYADDIALRVEHNQPAGPETDLRIFRPAHNPAVVWSADGIEVTAVSVHHEPVDAVAYRIRTPDGDVVISGDTRVCDEVEELCEGASLLVHEACRETAMAERIKGTVFETIFSYHADTVALGAMAARAGVPELLLTHLIPQPTNDGEVQGFADDLRQGGYRGRITVGADLDRVVLGA